MSKTQQTFNSSSIVSKNSHEDVYEDASSLTDMDAERQSQYPTVFNFASTLASQALLAPKVNHFYLTGQPSVTKESYETTEVEDYIGNMPQRRTTTEKEVAYIDEEGGVSKNPYRATEVITSENYYKGCNGDNIEDIALHDRGTVYEIPHEHRSWFVREDSMDQPPTEVAVLESHEGLDYGAKGRETTLNVCDRLTEIITREYEEDVARGVNKHLGSVLKLDGVFFNNGTCHDDLLGTPVYGEFLRWYMNARPWMDVGIPEPLDTGKGLTYNLQKHNGEMIV